MAVYTCCHPWQTAAGIKLSLRTSSRNRRWSRRRRTRRRRSRRIRRTRRRRRRQWALLASWQESMH